jgi:hypothetical protein
VPLPTLAYSSHIDRVVALLMLLPHAVICPQDPALEASPAAAAKTRRRGKTMALAGPAAAAPDNKGVRKDAAKQAAANTAKPEAAPAAHLPAGTSKPPAGRGRTAADRKVCQPVTVVAALWGWHCSY